MIIIGIDPGKEGGICILNTINKGISVRKMPATPKELLVLLQTYSKIGNVLCVMEKVQGLPRMGGSAMFNFGKGFGYLEMALLATQIKTITVIPQKWQKHYSLGTASSCATSTIWKNKLKAKAEQLFPKQNIFLWGADAILIAEYGRANNLT